LALSIYLVMQQMEAVIFRVLILSVPVWLVWRSALHTQNAFVPDAEIYEVIGWSEGSGGEAISTSQPCIEHG
jgi:hypothetical protein